ncbi:MAG: hypothetical protein SCARUB_00451 [Candidatus Scalindua rubra]|uniref:Uncharacterized protein n=1 Tax=Candidatus Scalindua rubra TaxID=1872076 RepID=A0A1E3XFR3_9BACT|nr:MAG: hypothetical protein SCARUB_00451 [Candidatus Scalindua rubra]
MTFNSIDELRIMLEQAGAANVPGYIDKLRANSKNNEVFDDLLFEGRAALMFLRNGFLVEMQERPDISIKLGNDQFYAEVKNFRLKEQDRIGKAKWNTVNQPRLQRHPKTQCILFPDTY